jgi:hypothetical protein
MTLRSKLCALGSLAAVGLYIGPYVGPADARECRWYGTSPFCEGQCPRGWKTTKYKACFSGWKILCCEPQGFISQGQRRR